ncbi:hypothetical protein ALC62_14955 [Cyphomyrmex costatus]|uniref:Ribosome biogenesis protein NOP53 n=2 Tax=Cyphomyrmex costatus TaxID=456900 RepID=A0A195C0Z4_9HYME|nr:hypothetical protein ALC62_14955 [Cyphomyrmex costatus]
MLDTKIKKHKVSKKTKRSWRKYIDTNDVDTFLDNNRLEERLGIRFSERTDTQLFTVDKTAHVTENVISKRATRLALKNKEPRCFASLKSHTCVPDPISKRNRVRTKEERMNSILRQREVERKLKGVLKLKEKEALKNRILAKVASANRPKRGDRVKEDIWNSTNVLLSETDTEWLSSNSIRHTLKHLGMKKRKLPLLCKKPSVLPAVEIPHPGTSYNPSYDDHQELLHNIVQKELELIKQDEHLNRVTTQMFKKVSLQKKEENMMKEMLEGLPNNQTASNFESIEDDNEENLSIIIANNKSRNNVKKTRVQKRKQREQKQAIKERALIKLEKRKVADIYKLRNLQKQLEAKEKKQEFLRQKRMKKRERESLMPKTLSKIKFEPIDPDFQLAEELTGNLRNCKPSNSLLKDRYKSLQQRNIIPPAIIKL